MNKFVAKKRRKHMLFVPADKPAMYRDLIIYKPDTIMFDLEDAISPFEKDSARNLVRYLVPFYQYNQYGIEVAVRVNGWDTEWHEKDVETCVAAKVNMIRLPKVEDKKQVLTVISLIEKYEKEYGITEPISLFLAFESAIGILNAFEIAKCSSRIKGIALGGMDYLLDLKAQRTPEQIEMLYARQYLIHVARATGINVFDAIYADVNDSAGFKKAFLFAKKLGFDGKSVIHPSQIRLINEIYTPSEEEINNAVEMVQAFKENQKKGLGVFQFHGQMVDKPVVEKAQETISLAIEFNLLKEGDLHG